MKAQAGRSYASRCDWRRGLSLLLLKHGLRRRRSPGRERRRTELLFNTIDNSLKRSELFAIDQVKLTNEEVEVLEATDQMPADAQCLQLLGVGVEEVGVHSEHAAEALLCHKYKLFLIH